MKEKLKYMVKTQIQARNVLDSRVIDAMQSVDRAIFVSKEAQAEAYSDYPLPIGYNQTISQPFIVAFMSELCRFQGYERVLEIGTGSGYQTAILSKLAKEVFTLERIEALSKRAAEKLDQAECKNIHFKVADGYYGWQEEAPFDVIILTACPPDIPQALVKQLNPDGGRLIGPEGVDFQQLVKITRHNKQIEKEYSLAVRFVQMV